MIIANIEVVHQSLWIMLQGMLGIFIFTGIFYLLIYLMEKIFRVDKKS
jgi:hypothetical protein